ncbi:hypothetical protein ACOSQ2_023498 [Xanthoceras sorbifolium]
MFEGNSPMDHGLNAPNLESDQHNVDSSEASIGNGNGGTAFEMHQALNGAGQAENFQRNVRPRKSENQEDFTPAGMTWNPHFQTANQPTSLYQFDQASNIPPIKVAPPIQPPVQTRLFSQSITVPRPGRSPALAVNGGHTQQQEENLRHNPLNMNFDNGNARFPGIVGSAAPNSYISPFAVWNPYMVNHFGGHGTYRPVELDRTADLAPSPVVRHMQAARGIIAKPSQMPVDPRPIFCMTRAERQAGDHFEPQPLIVRNITGAEYREMVGNQELLELEEEIGPVTIGLNSDSILVHLRQRKYQPISIEAGAPAEGDFCCVCQEEYVVGDDIGKLDCGHEYHPNCISQWLVLNNTCPICKARGLLYKDEDIDNSKATNSFQEGN